MIEKRACYCSKTNPSRQTEKGQENREFDPKKKQKTLHMFFATFTLIRFINHCYVYDWCPYYFYDSF